MISQLIHQFKCRNRNDFVLIILLDELIAILDELIAILDE
jgi:hypothetical protein